MPQEKRACSVEAIGEVVATRPAWRAETREPLPDRRGAILRTRSGIRAGRWRIPVGYAPVADGQACANGE
jgi:hypothetical protein